MAHEVYELEDGRHSMAYQGRTPWHGLGQEVDPDASIDVWAERAGLDWAIQRRPLFYNPESSDKVTMPVSGKVALVRSDDDQCLSIVSERYRVVQPKEVLEFYRTLVEAGGFKINTAGSLQGGRKYWAMAELGESFMVGGNYDKVDGYLLLATSCDASLATTARFTSVRVVCNNTLTMAYGKDNESVVTIPHRMTFDANEVKAQMGLAHDAVALLKKRANQLAKIKLEDKEAIEFLIRVMGDPEADPEEQPNATNIKKVYMLYAGEGAGSSLDSSKGTAWGLVNGVTEFYDHHAKAQSVDNRLNRAWFGEGERHKQAAMTEGLKLVA